MGSKAAALILLNVVLTFSAGLLARNFVLNPELAKIERINDEKILRQLAVIENITQNTMAESIRRIKATAARSSDRDDQFTTALFQIAASSDLNYIIAASANGSLLQFHPGAHFNSEKAPTPETLNGIVDAVKTQSSGRQPFVNLLNTGQGPLVIAADQLPKFGVTGENGPSLFIAVKHVNAAIIERINQLAGVELQLMNAEQFGGLRNEPRALSGLRSDNNYLLPTVNPSLRRPLSSHHAAMTIKS
ncbi:MAG: hypothetical protein ACI9G5_001042 [Paracoccaceae bacterium]